MKRKVKYLLSLVVTAIAFMAFTIHENEGFGIAAGKWKMGIALYSFRHHTITKALDMSSNAGVKYVEGFSFYNLGSDFKNKTLGELEGEELELMKKMLADRKLSMSSMYVGGAKDGKEWKKYFELGRKLKMKYLVCEPRKDHLDLIDSLAGVYKIKIAIHEHVKGSSIYWHPDSVLAAIKGRKNIGACADLGHWVRSGLDPVKCLETLSGHVIGVHLKDIDKSGRDVDLGKGLINFPGVVNELKKQKFAGIVNSECEHNEKDNLENVKQALGYFNMMAEKK